MKYTYLFISCISCLEYKLHENIVGVCLEFSKYSSICWQADEREDVETWTKVEKSSSVDGLSIALVVIEDQP